MRTKLCLLVALVAVSAFCFAESLSLDGQWRFELDRKGVGIEQRWFARTLPGQVRLPGTLAEQGIGDDVSLNTPWIGTIVDKSFFTAPEYEKYRRPGHIKVPFWLQPDKYYAGVAWYQRDIQIPEEWRAKRLVLFLERAHWETRVWVDSKAYGANNALATPHEYDLGLSLAPGKHVLTIRVDNRLVVDVGENSHSVSDHTQGNWNGIVGKIALEAVPAICIEDLQVFASSATKPVVVRGRITDATRQPGRGEIVLSTRKVGPGNQAASLTHASVSWAAGGGQFEVELPGEFETWDEFNPVLYEVTATLLDSTRSVRFGRREIATQGTQFLLNGRKLFIRGTLECAIFPATGHPAVDVDSWKRIIRIAKAHGLNNIRFHSWCPPEAAFTAADELGFYYHVECSSWANQSTTLGDGKPVDKWIYAEADGILKAYGNHPSFLFMLYGNEPGGEHNEEYLSKWVKHYREKDPRRLYSSGAGWPQLAENQFHVTAEPRIQAWEAGLSSRINSKPPETQTDYRDFISRQSVPVISHEIGQWCVYPNFDEIIKYKGYLKPKNFEIFRDRLEEHGLVDQARDFLLASGRLQTLCYKEDIESALRTPGMGGFQLLDLHDFPGQGTALVGVLDPFWDSKSYVTAEEYARFCNSTVLLARLPKRVFSSNETFEAAIEIAHFGPRPLKAAVAEWKVVDQAGRLLSAGQLLPRDIPIDNGISLGTISVGLEALGGPGRFKLIVGLDGTPFENDWDFWIYPRNHVDPRSDGVTVTRELNRDSLAVLEAGGKVFLILQPDQVLPDPKLGKIELGFSSIFWNTAWTSRQAPHTLGILCDPKHPALSGFPTDSHTNWQWWYLLSPGRAAAMILDQLPPGIKPIVQVIDDWFTARRLGLVFEAKVGTGKLLVSSIDLETGLDTNLVARQLRSSLLGYMTSDRFNPQTEVSPEQLRKCFSSGLMLPADVKYAPNWESLDKRPTPDWYLDAKFGIFIHWGVYSVPAWGAPKEYAEWYWNKMADKKPANVWWQFHKRNYGESFDYKEFAPLFRAELFNPDQWADIFVRSGARYIVPTSKHHEGFALWPSAEASQTWGRPWNAVEIGPKRDLLGDLGEACRKRGLKYGFYYSLYEWFNPLWLSDRNRYVDEHMIPQFKDVVTRYRPAIIFSDGEWDMDSKAWKSEELLAWLFNESPVAHEVVVNDRWGKDCRHTHGGYYTTEYAAGMKDASHPWEESRGMAYSYGYNRAETIDDYKTGREFVMILVDLVSRGGNFLLDIGPTADGRIPVIMQQRLLEIGDWLKVNGEAIYGTRFAGRSSQWSEGQRPGQEFGEYMIKYDLMNQIGFHPKDGVAVKQAFFTKKPEALYAILPGWPGKEFTIRDLKVPSGFEVTMLGWTEPLSAKVEGRNLIVQMPSVGPEDLPCRHAYTLKITGAELLPE